MGWVCLQEVGCRASAALVPMWLPIWLPILLKPILALGAWTFSDPKYLTT